MGLGAGQEQTKQSPKEKQERGFGYISFFVMTLLALLQVIASLSRGALVGSTLAVIKPD